MVEGEGMGKAAHGRQGGSTHNPQALVHTYLTRPYTRYFLLHSLCYLYHCCDCCVTLHGCVWWVTIALPTWRRPRCRRAPENAE